MSTAAPSPNIDGSDRGQSSTSASDSQRSTMNPDPDTDPQQPLDPRADPERPASLHRRPSSDSIPLSFPAATTMHDSQPQPALHPAHYLPLLHCPQCSPSVLLNAPTTLHCGHSICSEHVALPDPSTPPAARTGPPILPACPLPTCMSPPSSLRSIRPNIPPDSSVTYYPPSTTQTPRVVSPAATPNRVADVRLDVTVCKVLSLVQRANHRSDSDEGFVAVPPVSYDEGSDDEDSGPCDSYCEEHTSRPDALAPSSTTGSVLSGSLPRSRADERPHKRQRTAVPTNPPVLPSPPVPPATKFAKELLAELTCEICFMLLYQPITTPCQHTFCAKCLQRAIDHSVQCPICRADLPGFSYFQDHPSNKLILSIILKAFPDAYAERKAAIEVEERDSRLDMPIFVCQLSFPGTPTILHFFEPRYRLMLRRCLETPTPRFGMIMPPRTAGGGTDFGTLLEIRTVQMFPDGRSMVETWGVRRFRILERGSLDGYMVGRIEMIDDFSLDVDDALHSNTAALNEAGLPPSLQHGVPATNAELMAVCQQFLDKLRNGTAPWVVQRLNHTYGPEPVDDPAHFSFWMALVLPIDEHEKAKLLPIRSPRLRLRLVVHWIEQLNNNWWFSNGCVIS